MTFEAKMRKEASKMQETVGHAIPLTRQASKWLKSAVQYFGNVMPEELSAIMATLLQGSIAR